MKNKDDFSIDLGIDIDSEGLIKALFHISDSIGGIGTALENGSGFSFRDEVAMRAVQGMMVNEDQTGMSPSFIANHAYSIADAMIKERGRA